MNRRQQLVMSHGHWDPGRLVCPRCRSALSSLVSLEGNPETNKELLSYLCADAHCRCSGVFIIDGSTGEVTPVIDQDDEGIGPHDDTIEMT